MSSEWAIEVDNLGKSYHIFDKPRDRLLQMFWRGRKQLFRDFRALEDVSFRVGKGETVGIIGRNGSGKSTLLQIVCGTLNPTSGTVQTHGRIAALLELGAGFNPEFTGRENVYLSAGLYGLSRLQIDERFEQVVAFADIGDFIDQPVKSYSSGMFVRLAFAVIAHVDADILIVDEALAVGDAFFTQKCMRFLRDFMRNGTVLFVSHDTAAVKALCSRAIWLQNGKLVAQGSAKKICDAYLGEMISANQGSEVVVPAAFLRDEDELAASATATPIPDDGSTYVLPFNAASASFGAGGATIFAVGFFDLENSELTQFAPYTEVELRVSVDLVTELTAPIIGFFVRDRLGQTLFGSNTLQSPHIAGPCVAGKTLVATFRFVFPALPSGDYTVSTSIADGTQQDHVQLHWIHDAVALKTQGVHDIAGLVGMPMNAIRLTAL